MQNVMGALFLKPRIGSMYQQGWNNYHTLVFGSHIPCLVPNCEFKELCCSAKTIIEMDNKCPEYAGKHDDSLRLSNANIIELEAYINGEANYPYYSAFTKNILGAFDSISKEKKESFWEYVTFSNYFQCFTKSSSLPEDIDYAEHIGALRELLEHLNPHPQIIYVWTERLCKFLNEHYREIDGLRPLSKSNESIMQGCFVNCFAYKNSLEMEDVENSYNKNKTVEKMKEHLFPQGYTDILPKEIPFLENKAFKEFVKNPTIVVSDDQRKLFEFVVNIGIENNIFKYDNKTGRLRILYPRMAALFLVLLSQTGYSYNQMNNLFSPTKNNHFEPFTDGKLATVINNAKRSFGKLDEKKLAEIRDKITGEIPTIDNFNAAITELGWVKKKLVKI